MQKAPVDTAIKPMNGTHTHPLTAPTIDALRDIARKPVPRQEVNPGRVNRLLREALVEEVDLPSPYKKSRNADGGNVVHLRITDAGRAAIGEARQGT